MAQTPATLNPLNHVPNSNTPPSTDGTSGTTGSEDATTIASSSNPNPSTAGTNDTSSSSGQNNDESNSSHPSHRHHLHHHHRRHRHFHRRRRVDPRRSPWDRMLSSHELYQPPEQTGLSFCTQVIAVTDMVVLFLRLLRYAFLLDIVAANKDPSRPKEPPKGSFAVSLARSHAHLPRESVEAAGFVGMSLCGLQFILAVILFFSAIRRWVCPCYFWTVVKILDLFYLFVEPLMFLDLDDYYWNGSLMGLDLLFMLVVIIFVKEMGEGDLANAVAEDFYYYPNNAITEAEVEVPVVYNGMGAYASPPPYSGSAPSVPHFNSWNDDRDSGSRVSDKPPSYSATVVRGGTNSPTVGRTKSAPV